MINRRDVYLPKYNPSEAFVPSIKDNLLHSPFDNKKSLADVRNSNKNLNPNLAGKKDSDYYSQKPAKDLIIKNKPDSMSPEAQEIDYKIQKYKEDQLKQLLEKKKEQQELRQIYLAESNRKLNFLRDQKNEIQKNDFEIVNQAKISIERDKNLQAIKKEQNIRLAEENNKASLEKMRYEKTINQIEAFNTKKMQENYAKNLDLNEQKYQEKFKNIENIQNKRKENFEKMVPDSIKYDKKPVFKPNQQITNAYSEDINTKQKEEIKNRLLLLEDLRIKESQKPKKNPNFSEYEKNLYKFFGVDEDLSTLQNSSNIQKAKEDQELPSSSEFKQIDDQLKPNRYAKTNLKSIIHDPITGSISNYKVDRPKPRSLGTKAPEVFPGKIYDSPPQAEYELPKFTKKAPKNSIFNPLTGETLKVENLEKTEKLAGSPSFKFLSEDK